VRALGMHMCVVSTAGKPLFMHLHAIAPVL
jgi:hypothetical protein